MLPLNRFILPIAVFFVGLHAFEDFRIAQRLNKPLSGSGGQKPCVPPVELAVDSSYGTLVGSVSPSIECGALALSLLKDEVNLDEFTIQYKGQVDENVQFQRCQLTDVAFHKQLMIWSLRCKVLKEKIKFGIAEGIVVGVFAIALALLLAGLVVQYRSWNRRRKILNVATTGSMSATNETAVTTASHETGATEDSVFTTDTHETTDNP